MSSLKHQTLFITGASRGIGLAIALRAARDGANVVVAAKTAEPHPKLPGTIHTAAEAIERVGGRALPLVLDVRDEGQIAAAVDQAVATFGGIDILVNNASAISLTGTLETPVRLYDRMMTVNTRGTFLCSQACLPALRRSANPHILNLSPPLNLAPKWFGMHVAYTMAKYGMSLCVLGMAEEFRRDGIAVNALWPRTAIATAAIEFAIGDQSMLRHCRKPEIVADAAHWILTRRSRELTGQFLIDDDVLARAGVTDFAAYAVDPTAPLVLDFFLDEQGPHVRRTIDLTGAAHIEHRLTMSETVVVVGASHAAVQAIDTLHREGHPGPIVLVGDEPHLPYNRPPLSKKFLTGELERERLLLRSAHFYENAHVTTRLGVRATALDRGAQRLRLSDGGELHYDKLLLCVGSRPRQLDVPGHDLAGVHYLRTIADVEAIRGALPGAESLVVVGAGYIGLEAAASARHLGLEVTVLEMADRPMNRVVAPEISQFYLDRHTREGVHIVCNATVDRFEGDGHVRRVVSGSREYAADIVVVGVGIVPDNTLAASAGLRCENGLWVDEHCRTSDANVFAAGDCTNHPSLRYGRRVRLESVDNAVEQGKVAALNICGKPAVHEHVPWFWSDQYDVKLQIAGLATGYDQTVLRGNPASGSFGLFYLLDGELLAVDAINNPRDFMTGKRWIAERKRPDPVRLADTSVDLKTI